MDDVLPSLDAEEQRARVRRTIEEAEKLAAETRKLIAETGKYRSEARFHPWSVLFQGTLAATAVMGAGVAIAKLFLI